MKKLFAIIFSAIIISVSAFAISGCGCNKEDTTTQPSTEIVGNWGGRSDDIEAEFKEDGSCVIGGVTGTYEIDENNTLTVTPNSSEETSAQPLTFEHYNNNNNTSAIQPNQWAIIDNVLYINGQQYNGVTNTTDSSNTQGNNSNNQNSSANSSSGVASNQSSSSSNSANSGSSSSSSSNNSSSSSGSSSSSSSSTNNSNSSTPTDSTKPTDSNSSSSSTPDSSVNNSEDQVVDIVENLDDF